jgi:hypothetical protein
LMQTAQDVVRAGLLALRSDNRRLFLCHVSNGRPLLMSLLELMLTVKRPKLTIGLNPLGLGISLTAEIPNGPANAVSISS